MAKASMMVALSGSVALVVTVGDHKTMAKGGAQTRPPTTQCYTHVVHTKTCQIHKFMPKHKYTNIQIQYTEARPDPNDKIAQTSSVFPVQMVLQLNNDQMEEHSCWCDKVLERHYVAAA